MRTMKHVALAAAAAFALALAGCGGGGSSGGPTTPTPPPKSALSYATDLNASVAALKTLAGSAADKGSALMMASEAAGKLGVLDAGGDSSVETMNAQAILSAKAELEAAIADAKEKKTAAEGAKDGADADTKEALDTAIAAADTEIEDAQAVLDNETALTSLAAYVAVVTGTDKDKPKSPADKGKVIANLIDSALTRDGGVDDVVSDFNIVPTGTTDTQGKVMAGPSDAQGMTWAQIGGSGLMDKRIASAGDSTTVVKAMSVAGMKASAVFSTVPDSITTGNGTQITQAVSYKGIAGTLFCAGSDCKVAGTGADRKLTGSWYYAPTAGASTTYLAGTGDSAGTYTVEDPENYVRYGYWLQVASTTDDTTTIRPYIDGPGAQSGAVYGISSDVDAFKGTSADYKGSALGMSVVKTFDSKGKELTRASGGFTADVSLTMNFGNAPWLVGTISNFMGNGVDTSWSVDLKSQALSSGTFSDGVTGAGDYTGAWTATAFGGSADSGSEARPAGVFGEFDAKFTNGAAAGVYATRKE